MNLILQAIKSLLRKVENSIESVRNAIPKTLSDLLKGEKISGDNIDDMYYTEPDRATAFIEEQTLSGFSDLTEWPFNKNTNYAYHKEDFVYADYPFITDSTISSDTLDAKTEFAVMWDGVEYHCVAHDGDGMEMVVLGNAYLYSDSKDNTGEPFCIMFDSFYATQGMYVIANDTAESHIVEVLCVLPGEVHQMPEKYIPEHTHSVDDVNEGEFPIDRIPTITSGKLPVIPIEKGGTGATSVAEARDALGIGVGVCTTIGTSVSSLNIVTQYKGLGVSVIGAMMLVTFIGSVTFSGNSCSWYVDERKIGYLYVNEGLTKKKPTGTYSEGLYLIAKVFGGGTTSLYQTGYDVCYSIIPLTGKITE